MVSHLPSSGGQIGTGARLASVSPEPGIVSHLPSSGGQIGTGARLASVNPEPGIVSHLPSSGGQIGTGARTLSSGVEMGVSAGAVAEFAANETEVDNARQNTKGRKRAFIQISLDCVVRESNESAFR
jgi:hypothetical protein